MIEMNAWLAVGWTIGTAALSLGSAYGALRYQQAHFAKKLEELSRGFRRLEQRISDNEQNYVKTTTCKEEQSECGLHRDYHEGQLCRELQGIKELMRKMDEKREVGKDEFSQRLQKISEDVIYLRSRLPADAEGRHP